MLNRSGGCLAAAVAVIIVAGKYGRRLALQAGSAYWTRMTPEQDDGVSPTHFGYEWEDTPETRACIRAGMLPEIHVWAGDPARQEIVDPTSGEFPAQCRVLLGEDWLAPRPPDALWVPVAQIPPNAIYTPSREATQVAAVFAQRMLRGE